MKVLIGQIFIDFGQKTQVDWEGGASYLFYNYFQPSVKKYCQKYGYDYKCFTKATLDLPLRKGKAGANEKMIFFSYYDEYDLIAHIDIDVFITEKAPSLPDVSFAAVLDRTEYLEKLHSFNIPDYTNGGVYFFNSSTAKILWNETLKLQQGQYQKWHNAAHGSQTIVNYWVMKNKILKTILDERWNTMVFNSYWKNRWHKSYFIHYTIGKKYLFKDFYQTPVFRFNRFLKNLRKISIKNCYSITLCYLKYHYYSFVSRYSKREVTKQKRTPPLIVSLSSIPSRIATTHLAIETIFQQTLKPDRILLWLSDELSYKKLPYKLKRLEKRGLEIRFCKDIGPHTKYYYTLKENPNCVLILADDDMFYVNNCLKILWDAYQKDPSIIYGYYVHKIRQRSLINFESYTDWELNITNYQRASYFLFACNVGGVLYPPGSLPKETLQKEIFLKLCPKADDIWLKAMTILSRYPVKKVNNISFSVKNTIPYSQKIRLYSANKFYNDTQIKNVISYFNIIAKMDKLEKTLKHTKNYL